MDNMRRTLRQPGLRMADGGGFGKWVRETVFNAPKDYQPTKPAPAAPAAPAQKAITDYTSGAATERRMKAAGLRDGGDLRTGAGGHVPGKGTGDKVPAKYEPGEFVVSNDMLDAAPGLREDLHGLRGQVLAAKGMTPEQADAKALNGGSLRAAVGFETRPNVLAIPGTTNADVGRNPSAPREPDWTRDSEIGRNVSNTLNALAPVTGGLSSTLRAGAVAGKAFNAVAPLAAVPGLGQLSKISTPAPAPAGAAAPSGSGNPFDAANKAMLDAYGASTPSPSPSPSPSPRDPAPTRRVDGGSSPLFTNLAEDSTDNAALMGRGSISPQNMAAADALDARYAAERAGERASAAQAAAPAQTGLRGGLFDTPKARRADRELDLREADSLRSDATARRGQDITLRGQDSTRAVADRGYQLDVQKFGVEAANKRRDDKRAGEAAFDQRVLSFVGTDKDGKPDAAAASRVRNVANAFLSEKLTAARQLLAREPNNKSAQAVIDSITREGVGGIDDDTMRKFMLNEQGNRVAAEYDGWAINPFAGKATNTSRPIGSLRLEDNMILPNQYVTENGQKIPKRAVEANPDLRALIK